MGPMGPVLNRYSGFRFDQNCLDVATTNFPASERGLLSNSICGEKVSQSRNCNRGRAIYDRPVDD